MVNQLDKMKNPTLSILKQLLWMNKITLSLIFIFTTGYLLTNEQQILDLLTYIGIAYLLYGGLLTQAYTTKGHDSTPERNLHEFHMITEYEKSKTEKDHLRILSYLDSATITIIQGFVILGVTFLLSILF